MAANPQSFFRFAARYYALLLDLFYRREGFTEADLRNLIEGIASEGDPHPSTVIDQLLSFSIIEPIPDATATFAKRVAALPRVSRSAGTSVTACCRNLAESPATSNVTKRSRSCLGTSWSISKNAKKMTWR